MAKKCTVCYGAKKLPGLGMLMKDCKRCNGVGYIESETVKAGETPLNVVSSSAPVLKKKGKAKRAA